MLVAKSDTYNYIYYYKFPASKYQYNSMDVGGNKLRNTANKFPRYHL